MLPSGPSAAPGRPAAGVARRLASLTGDAGWAGVLAESFLADPRRTAAPGVPAGNGPPAAFRRGDRPLASSAPLGCRVQHVFHHASSGNQLRVARFERRLQRRRGCSQAPGRARDRSLSPDRKSRGPSCSSTRLEPASARKPPPCRAIRPAVGQTSAFRLLPRLNISRRHRVHPDPAPTVCPRPGRRQVDVPISVIPHGTGRSSAPSPPRGAAGLFAVVLFLLGPPKPFPTATYPPPQLPNAEKKVVSPEIKPKNPELGAVTKNAAATVPEPQGAAKTNEASTKVAQEARRTDRCARRPLGRIPPQACPRHRGTRSACCLERLPSPR